MIHQYRNKNEISISFDKEDYAKERQIRHSKMSAVVLKAVNSALLSAYFHLWRDTIRQQVRQEQKVINQKK